MLVFLTNNIEISHFNNLIIFLYLGNKFTFFYIYVHLRVTFIEKRFKIYGKDRFFLLGLL